MNKRSLDLILADAMMPGMDGYKARRRIKKNGKNRIIPILMVTALREKEELVDAMNTGADDFLSKPVDSIELLVRAKSLLSPIMIT